jgi:hypothetical protein
LTDTVSGGCLAPTGFSDTIGGLPAGASGTRTVTFVALAAGTCTNTVTISAANASPASDSVTIVVTP